MNGYMMMKESYENLVKQGKMTQEQAEPEIRVYDFLAGCSKDDFYRIMDSSAMNDIIKSYTKEACKDAGLTEEQQEAVQESLRWLLDTKTAREVAE